MNKWKRFRYVEIVDVLQFTRPKDPHHPPLPFRLNECGCEPQDGYTCEQHGRTPRFSYHVDAVDRRMPIRIGEILVKFSDGRMMTCAPEELGGPRFVEES